MLSTISYVRESGQEAPGLVGLGEFDGVVKSGLDGGLLCGNVGSPGYGNAGEGLGDEEPIP